MSISQTEKANQFRVLHQGPASFIIANAWDAGSARILAGLGFDAVATSSGAFAATLGRRDGKVTREEALSHCKAVCEAIDLPVSADLENGFGDAPEVAAETVRLAANTGLVGCSIEDSTGDRDNPLYEFDAAVERIVQLHGRYSGAIVLEDRFGACRCAPNQPRDGPLSIGHSGARRRGDRGEGAGHLRLCRHRHPIVGA